MAGTATQVFRALITADADGAVKELKQFEGQTKKIDQATTTAGTRATAAFGGMRTAVAAVGVGAAFALGKQAINAASDLEESVNAVKVTFGDAAGGVLAIGENSATSFGLAKSEFNGLAVQFSSFAKEVAGPGGDVAAVIDDLAGRAADFASVMDLDLNEATAVFMSTLAGETEPIRRFGKDVSAAAVELYALENGLAASKAEITESVKVQARYGLLMEQTADTAGDFANTSDSLANQQRILNAELKDGAAEIGQHLLPLAADLAKVLNATLVPAIGGAAKALTALFDASEAFGREAGDALFGGNRVENYEFVRGVEEAELAVGALDTTIFEGVKTFGEARAVALQYGDEVLDLENAHSFANKAALDFKRTVLDVAAAEKEAKRATQEARLEEVEHERALRDLNASYDNVYDNTRELEQANRDHYRGLQDLNKGYDNVAGSVDNAADSLRDFNAEFEDMRDQLSDRGAWDDLQDGFDGYLDALVEAGETSDKTARQQEADARSVRAEQDALIGKVIAYGDELGNLPDNVTSELIAMIDSGSVMAAEAILERIARQREALIVVRTSQGGRVNLAGGGGSRGLGFGTQVYTPQGEATASAKGAVIGQPTLTWVGEAGEREWIIPESAMPSSSLPGNRALPDLSGMGGGGVSIGQIVVSAPSGANADDFGRAVRKAIVREIRHNGPVSGWAA